MRLNEFASATDTLALWKMISDNTWAAIAQQAEAEAKQKAERAAARKSVSKRGSGKSTVKSTPPKRLPPPLHHVSAPVAKDAKSTASAAQAKTQVGKGLTQQMVGGVKQPQANATNQQLPNAVGTTQPQPAATNPQAAQVQQPQKAQQPLTPQQMRLHHQNVGSLVKNSAVAKRM